MVKMLLEQVHPLGQGQCHWVSRSVTVHSLFDGYFHPLGQGQGQKLLFLHYLIIFIYFGKIDNIWKINDFCNGMKILGVGGKRRMRGIL